MKKTGIFAMHYHKYLGLKPLSATVLSLRCQFTGMAFFLIPLLLTGCDESQVVSAHLRSVKTWVVSAAQPSPSLTWTGTLEPAEEVTLQFRIDGKLAGKPVDIGATVIKNQIVATLNGSLSHGQAAAVLAEFRDAVVAEQKGRTDLERTRKLYTIGTASKAQLEEAIASLAKLNAQKIHAEAQKNSAFNNSDFSSLKSPFNGIVTAYVPYPGQNITAGQDILKIASTKAEVKFSLSSALAAKLRPGSNIIVTYGDDRIPGQIRFISPQLDSTTLTSTVRASLSHQKANFVFGTPVSVELAVPGNTVIALPSSALTRSGNQPAVFVVDKNSKLESRPVTIDRFSADMAYVSAGLKAGEKVVTAGVNTLESGEQVNISSEVQK